MVNQGVEFHQFPDSLLKELKVLSAQVLEETMNKDSFSKEVKDSYLNFLHSMSLDTLGGAAL
jgi:TRAP-type mannitol/chloroaromatic compound transport system substrate-binding protein